MSFHVGQNVVCVDDSPSMRTGLPVPSLHRGQVYVIRGFSRHPSEPELWGLLIEGLVDASGEKTSAGDEPGFAPSRFRPVIERKTDISIFTEMLTPKSRVLEDIGT